MVLMSENDDSKLRARKAELQATELGRGRERSKKTSWRMQYLCWLTKSELN